MALVPYPARGLQDWDDELKLYIDDPEALAAQLALTAPNTYLTNKISLAIASALSAGDFATASALATGLNARYTKTESDGRYATTAQGAKADTAVQPAAISNVNNTSDANKPVSTAQAAADAAILAGTDIAASTDLNSLTTPGVYRALSTSLPSLALNYPVATAGLLEVRRINSTSFIQKFYPFTAGTDSRAFYVRRSSGGFLPWRSFTAQRVVTAVEQPGPEIYTWDDTAQADRQILATRIPLDTVDLDLITVDGVYIQSATGSATLARHYPVAGVLGTLEVSSGLQRFTPRATSTRGTYIRSFAGSIWQPWRYIAPPRIVNPLDQPGVEMYLWDEANAVEKQVTATSIPLGTVDLNLVTVAGTYIQTSAASAQTVRNYPVTNLICILEVFVISSTAMIQRMTPQGGSGSSSVRGSWARRMNGGVWDAWQYTPRQRVDETAGRAIYHWDDLNNRDQLIFGDTGWRNITASLGNGWTATSVLLARRGRTVSLRFRALDGSLATNAALLTGALPAGYLPYLDEGMMLRPVDNGLPLYGTVNSIGTVSITNPGVARTVTPTQQQGIDFTTNDAWPTTSPGTASGTIPNT